LFGMNGNQERFIAIALQLERSKRTGRVKFERDTLASGLC